MSAAIRRTTLSNEHTRRWRQFWQNDAAEYVGSAFLIEAGDTWATVRDATTHKLLDQFVIDTFDDEIFVRLAQLLLNRSPQ